MTTTIIYVVHHRHIYGKRPDQVSDHVVGYYSTLEKAHDTIRDFLGDAACDDSWGFEVWTSPHLPHTEYHVSRIEVY